MNLVRQQFKQNWISLFISVDDGHNITMSDIILMTLLSNKIPAIRKRWISDTVGTKYSKSMSYKIFSVRNKVELWWRSYKIFDGASSPNLRHSKVKIKCLLGGGTGPVSIRFPLAWSNLSPSFSLVQQSFYALV